MVLTLAVGDVVTCENHAPFAPVAGLSADIVATVIAPASLTDLI